MKSVTKTALLALALLAPAIAANAQPAPDDRGPPPPPHHYWHHHHYYHHHYYHHPMPPQR